MLAQCGRMSDCPGRRIVLHADDFGMNPLVTDGILRGFEHGLLTSVSALANAPDVGRALREWKRLEPDRSNHDLPSSACRRRLEDPDRGLRPWHTPESHPRATAHGRTATRPNCSTRKDAFPECFAYFAGFGSGGRRFAAALQSELSCQIQVLLDHGHRPTHLNGHQYVEDHSGRGPDRAFVVGKVSDPGSSGGRGTNMAPIAVVAGNWCDAMVPGRRPAGLRTAIPFAHGRGPHLQP